MQLFLSKLQFGVSRTNLKGKNLTSLLFNFKFNLKTRTLEELARNTNDIKVSPIQKGTDMFTVLIKRTFPGIHKNVLTPIRLY